MTNETLNRLLNDACEIITSLEEYANDDLKKDIEALFNEIKYSDELDEEMKISNQKADDEAQDWDTFKQRKI